MPLSLCQSSLPTRTLRRRHVGLAAPDRASPSGTAPKARAPPHPISCAPALLYRLRQGLCEGRLCNLRHNTPMSVHGVVHQRKFFSVFTQDYASRSAVYRTVHDCQVCCVQCLVALSASVCRFVGYLGGGRGANFAGENFQGETTCVKICRVPPPRFRNFKDFSNFEAFLSRHLVYLYLPCFNQCHAPQLVPV